MAPDQASPAEHLQRASALHRRGLFISIGIRDKAIFKQPSDHGRQLSAEMKIIHEGESLSNLDKMLMTFNHKSCDASHLLSGSRSLISIVETAILQTSA